MKRFCIAILGLMAASLLPAQSLSMQLASQTIAATYSTSTEVVANSSVTVSVTGNGFLVSNVFVTFSAGGSGSFSQRTLSHAGTSDTLNYQVYDSATSQHVLKDLSGSPSENEVLSGTVYKLWNIAQKSATMSFSVVLPVGQCPQEGSYTDQLTVSLYEGTVGSGSPTLISTATLYVNVTMPKIVDMSLVSSDTSSFVENSRSLTLDFGNMENGTNKAVNLFVLSNSSYSLSVSSANGMIMKNVDTSDTSEVPFTMAMRTGSGGNWANVTLPAGTLTELAQGSPSPSSQCYVLSFTIQDFGMASPGNYQNVLSFTISAK